MEGIVKFREWSSRTVFVQGRAMNITHSLYRGHRFSAEIIFHWIWLYFRFTLSYRDVKEMMAVRGITLTCETVRAWCCKFGQTFANQIRRSRP